jgi:hypothetical protein
VAVAFENRVLTAALEIQVDVDRDAGAAWPLRIGELVAVADEVARRF